MDAERPSENGAKPLTASLRVLIAGGGTGGHLFPGIAIAEEILRRSDGNQVVFVGTARGLEAKILPQRGYELRTIEISGLKGSRGADLIRGFGRLPRALLQSIALVRQIRPQLVVGVGGYASGPVLLAARMLRRPTAILEQNSIPGITNRILGRMVDRVFVTFEASEKYFPRRKTRRLGNPIRKEVAEISVKERRAQAGQTLLVLGGSQGAHALNELVAGALEQLARSQSPLPHLVHQTGTADEAAIRMRYQALIRTGVELEVRPFIEDMAAVYRQADLVLCRAGATTIAELGAAGLPAVFVPFPQAADDHQYHNAKALVDAGAALLFREAELTPEKLAQEIGRLLLDRPRLEAMRTRMRALAQPDAARSIVDELERIAHVSRS